MHRLGDFEIAQVAGVAAVAVDGLGDFAVSRNGSLATLTALDLVAINGSFIFDDNDEVEDFDGMYNLNSIGDDLSVTGNGALPYCQVCDLLAQLSGFNGTITCFDNIADPCWVEDALDCSE